MLPRIHLSPPHLGTAELPLVQQAFADNWVAPAGPHLPAFEAEFCAATGAAHAAAVASGTAALHLALRLVGVQPGDAVVCSTLTFIGSVAPITYVGAEPVLIDSDEATWNMCPVRLAEALADLRRRGRRIGAIVPVHLYGQAADIDPILALATEDGIPVIEDAAEALGATYKGRTPGTLAPMGLYSFNGNKIITTAGGGMLVGHDAALIAEARRLASQARDPAPHYEHTTVGYNYRLSNILAGIGRGQLQVLADRVRQRRAVFARYVAALGDLPGLSWMPEAPYGTATRWLTCLTLDPTATGGVTREDVRMALEAANIESRPVWKPMHLQPVFAHCPTYGGEVSARLFRDGLCLPSGSSLTEAEQDRVCALVRRTLLRA